MIKGRKMREILLTTFILVLMSLGVHAKPKTPSWDVMKGEFFLHRICVDGYLFVEANKGSVSIVQVFKEKNGRSVPVKCKS